MSIYPTICPRCNQGPDIYKISVEGIAIPLFVCQECDAVWLVQEEIGKVMPEDFETFLKKRGVDPLAANCLVEKII